MAEIYGAVTVLEEARDNIAGLMSALLTAMSVAGTDPRILAVHNGHENLISTFPAVSVDVIAHEIDQSSSARHTYPMRITVEIRVHTNVDYPGVFVDTIKVTRLINSIDNYLKTNGHSYLKTNMADGFARLVFDSSNNNSNAAAGDYQAAFPESNTVGGTLVFDMQCNYQYTQA